MVKMVYYCSLEGLGPVVAGGRVTETLTLQRSLVVASLTVLAHGSMPWESRTMVAVAVQGAPYTTVIHFTSLHHVPQFLFRMIPQMTRFFPDTMNAPVFPTTSFSSCILIHAHPTNPRSHSNFPIICLNIDPHSNVLRSLREAVHVECCKPSGTPLRTPSQFQPTASVMTIE